VHTSFSELYKACMDRLPGRKYIHHNPPDALSQEDMKARAERCVLTSRGWLRAC
jgi:hypothetical protein